MVDNSFKLVCSLSDVYVHKLLWLVIVYTQGESKWL